MIPQTHPRVLDPADLLNQAVEHAWHVLCIKYNVTASTPDMLSLFEGVDLSSPERTAEVALARMLLEIIDEVGRFSAWYKMPARSFGLISMRDEVSDCIRWMLSPEAVKQLQEIIDPLAVAVEKNTGLIHAILLVEHLMRETPEDDPCLKAQCTCDPPRTIRIKKSVLDRAEIICDICLDSFVST
jgi:hypothetical protein